MGTKMNIILEGCDCVGKSSIASNIVKLDPNYTVMKRNAVKSYTEGKSQYSADIELLNSKTNLIFDRFMYSEAVYAPIFRNYFPEYLREFEHKLSSNNLLVLVYARPEIVKKRFDGKFIKEEQIELIMSSFFRLFDQSQIPYKTIIDTSFESSESLAFKLLESIKKEELKGGQKND